MGGKFNIYPGFKQSKVGGVGVVAGDHLGGGGVFMIDDQHALCAGFIVGKEVLIVVIEAHLFGLRVAGLFVDVKGWCPGNKWIAPAEDDLGFVSGGHTERIICDA